MVCIYVFISSLSRSILQRSHQIFAVSTLHSRNRILLKVASSRQMQPNEILISFMPNLVDVS